jgi:hypothetical protein
MGKELISEFILQGKIVDYKKLLCIAFGFQINPQ